MTMVKTDNELALQVPAPDPTVLGTLAYFRWHKDDSPAALARYESRFITHAFLHPYEVTDGELERRNSDARAHARQQLGAGHLHEPQARLMDDHEGLSIGP